MPKTFITERDIDEMKARGITQIDLTENIVLTDLAMERAFAEGIKVNRPEQTAAPKASFSPSVNLVAAFPREAARASAGNAELAQKVKAMVLARLDGQVDSKLLDAVIARVLNAMK
jgi:hypothetical protein